MIIYVESIGGPNDGELIATELQDYIAEELREVNFWDQYGACERLLPTFNYFRRRSYFHFCGQYYYREFFICDDDKKSNEGRALKIMDSYFNPVFQKFKKGG
ncbi:hypothetical protein [Acinetobacter pittii]|uniref:hypothetical protein n=1 Tax=Acinetobacter pittii TaxID=48296 RepID=UPI000F747D1C|nr:hypothetical protein [Acinetobacter pittii]MDX8157808.1 hypothetical protein [Acinetobacter pittii]RSO48431.1 hypothetical protein EA757_07030 [Acinetobacter pittii]RSO77821.1 hypothetical protein EA753_07940 [Acinetobacter pittii]HIN56151.1 hypothetical protein [Acinetobacter pittii]